MANQFSITPANPLQALMAFDQSYQGARKRTQEDEAKAARQEASLALQSGGDTRSILARLAGVDPQAAVAMHGLTKGDTTDAIRNYQYGQANPAFNQHQLELKRASGTNVNVNTGDKEYDKVRDKALADRFEELRKGSASATAKLPTLDLMENLTNQPDFYSGVGAEKFVLPMQQIIGGLGGDPKAGSSIENFRALSSKYLMDATGGKLGAGISNTDVSVIQSTIPNLANSAEGNRAMIDIMRKVAKREQQVFKLAREYSAKNGGRIDAGFDDFLADWAEKNPLFPKAQTGQNPAVRATGTGGQLPKIRMWSPETGVQ